ncbi:hypothetical protein KFE98_02200 [bacterium SCSIO 12741]|nr:hypothetical protein KFE98_02200 [bacterium SCSIO 12741]
MNKVVFMGGKRIGHICLKILLERAEELNAEVIAVFENRSKLSAPEDSLESVAKAQSIPVYYDMEGLFELEPFDTLISVQYHEILLPRHIELARQLAINLHMAPLPEYRGCNQFSFALIDGAEEFGTSIHRLTPKIDGGPLLFESRFPIPENCFVKDLYNQTVEASIRLFEQSIASILKGEVTEVPQEKLDPNRNRGFHLRKEMADLKEINANWPLEKQKRYFRATWFPPFDPPQVKNGDQISNADMAWYNSLD